MRQAQLEPSQGTPARKVLCAASSQAWFEVRERPVGKGRMNGTSPLIAIGTRLSPDRPRVGETER
ncbi:MAG: hypothetical protein BGP11_18600 [Rhodobacterales bacterium 65-51]|nr:MAG: hypothetical protein BGP11_18600 [Rhodobacterales bacterium 65-51]